MWSINRRRPLFACLIAAPLLAVLTYPVEAGTYSQIYAFGDSLSDVGNAFALSGGKLPAPPYANGQFSNGPVWVQDLASDLGLAPLKASALGGTDYAVGGALSGTSPVYTTGPTDLPAQLAAFESVNPKANPNGLYTIWIGSNDLRAIVASLPSASQAAADIAAVVVNVDSAISTLAGEGAKNFLIMTVPDLGKTPEALALGSLGSALASDLSASYDSALVNGVGSLPSLDAIAAKDSLKLGVVDTYSLVDSIVGDPAKFGFTNVTSPCLSGSVAFSGGTVCAHPSQYLFWDDIHPTAAGHALIAQAAFAVAVPEPTSLLTLAAGALTLWATRRRSRLTVAGAAPAH